MKIFKGQPNPSRINEEHWERCLYKGWFIIRAENKKKARQIALSKSEDIAGEPGLFNPWVYEDSQVESENLTIFRELTQEEIIEGNYSLNGEEEILDKG